MRPLKGDASGKSDQSGQTDVEPHDFSEAVAAHLNMSPILEHHNEDRLNNSSVDAKSPIIRVGGIKHSKKNSSIPPGQDVGQSYERHLQQHDAFYMKEVRTFEEVFKSIK